LQEAAVHHLILAAITPDNTPGGYQWTYLFPMLLFIVIAAILYLLFSRPHRRVPARAIALTAKASPPPATAAANGTTVTEAEQTGEDTSA
jgi:hypothetical protein